MSITYVIIIVITNITLLCLSGSILLPLLYIIIAMFYARMRSEIVAIIETCKLINIFSDHHR